MVAKGKHTFISYSRHDSLSFALRLYAYLEGEDFRTWFDYVDIATGENYVNHIESGILQSQNFVFVLSPSSVASPHCMAEVYKAIEHGKRIIPIMHIAGDYDKLPAAISMPDWLEARQEAHTTFNRQQLQPKIANLGVHHPQVKALAKESEKFDTSNLEVAFTELKKVLLKEASYVGWHTATEVKAVAWANAGRPVDKLLIARDKVSSEARLRESITREFPPNITHLQAELICESKKNGEGLLTDVFITSSESDSATDTHIRQELHKKLVTTSAVIPHTEDQEQSTKTEYKQNTKQVSSKPPITCS